MKKRLHERVQKDKILKQTYKNKKWQMVIFAADLKKI